MKYVVVDVETASLDARFDPTVKVWCIGFAWKEGDTVKSKWHSWEVGKQHLETLLKDDSVSLVFHNASFDVAALRVRGLRIPPGKFHCSFLMAYLTRPGLGHSLADWGAELNYPKTDFHRVCVDNGWLDAKSKKGDEFFINFDENEAALSALGAYCERDCEVTLKLFKHLVDTVFSKDKKMRDNYYNVELPYVECVQEMENTGLFLDMERLHELKERLTRRRDELQVEIAKTYPLLPEAMEWNKKSKVFTAKAKEYKNGVSKNKNNDRHYTSADGMLLSSSPSLVYDHCPLTPFSTTNSRHLAWCLLSEGWKPERFTDSGVPSTEAEVVDTLDFPIAKLYTEVSGLEKLLGTFVNGLVDRADTRNVVRGSFHQCATLTTRLSSSNPNLQNLPASGDGVEIRRCVVAPPGYTVIVGDLDAIELRVLAYYLQAVCGDTGMADSFRAGADPHQANADRWKLTRKQAKTTIFGLVYGQTAKGLAARLGVSLEEAEVILKGVFDGTPALLELMSAIHRTARQRNGNIYTLLGTRLSYPDVLSQNKWDRMRAERQCQNALIQGSAANINKELQLQALPLTRKFKARQSTVVHDELLIYSPTTFADELIFNLNTKVYQNVTLLSKKDWFIPVTATFAKGENWVEAKEAG